MAYTISTHNGSAVNRSHNIRNPYVVAKQEHIEPKGVYEIWKDESEFHAYHRLFDEAVKKYNEKQTRPERKIKNYHSQVEKSSTQHTAYEMIVAVGSLENHPDFEVCKDILKEYTNGWERRNPNLELIGAYYHADEQGVPHVHLDYIPVAHGYTRGMETQAGLVKALGEQGFEKNGKATAQIQWEKSENQALELICKNHGLEIEHPLIEGRKHLDTEAYKLTQHIETLKDQTVVLERENNDLKGRVESLEKKGSKLAEKVSKLRGDKLSQKEFRKTVEAKLKLLSRDKQVTVDASMLQAMRRYLDANKRLDDVEVREMKVDVKLSEVEQGARLLEVKEKELAKARTELETEKERAFKEGYNKGVAFADGQTMEFIVKPLNKILGSDKVCELVDEGKQKLKEEQEQEQSKSRACERERDRGFGR